MDDATPNIQEKILNKDLKNLKQTTNCVFTGTIEKRYKIAQITVCALSVAY